MVETLSSHRLHPSLRDRVRPGCPEWRSHLLNAEMPQAAVECGAITIVTVVNQKPWWQSIPRAALHYLLGRPRRCWKRRYSNVQDFPVNVPDYKEDIQRLKQYCLDTEEIAGPHARLMPLQEFAPTRGWPSTAPIHILRDCSRRNRKPPASIAQLVSAFDPKPIQDVA
jgi:hypothetical protein